ncbi:MAG: hypothetical protein HYV19_07500 [Gemmatimonadetes bacterium]|nr:hypothetical protein [Gemmatimonadota bacterium]
MSMMRVFPSQLQKGKARISRDRWVDYHYGYFTIALASMPDISFVLTATVHGLGLAPRYCTSSVVRSHDSVRGTAVARALNGIEKAVQLIKERRNAHVHRGELADFAHTDETEDEFVSHIKSITFIQSVDCRFVDTTFLKLGWREVIRTVVPRLERQSRDVSSAVVPLFDALLPHFVRRRDLLAPFDDRSTTT